MHHNIRSQGSRDVCVPECMHLNFLLPFYEQRGENKHDVVAETINIRFDLLSTLERFHLAIQYTIVHTKLQYFDIKLTIIKEKKVEKKRSEMPMTTITTLNIKSIFPLFFCFFPLIPDRNQKQLLFYWHKKIKFNRLLSTNKLNSLERRILFNKAYYSSYYWWIC